MRVEKSWKSNSQTESDWSIISWRSGVCVTTLYRQPQTEYAYAVLFVRSEVLKDFAFK